MSANQRLCVFLYLCTLEIDSTTSCILNLRLIRLALKAKFHSRVFQYLFLLELY